MNMESYELMEIVKEYQIRQRDEKTKRQLAEQANTKLVKAKNELVVAISQNTGDSLSLIAPGLDGELIFYEVDHNCLAERPVGKVLAGNGSVQWSDFPAAVQDGDSND